MVAYMDMSFSYFDTTKYTCLKCSNSVCNRCSVFQEEETPGWQAGKSVAFCIACVKEDQDSSTSSGRSLAKNSGRKVTEDDGKIMSIEYKEVSNSARNKYDKKVRRVNQQSILIIWVDPNK